MFLSYLQLLIDNGQYGICEIRYVFRERHFERFNKDVLSSSASIEGIVSEVLLALVLQEYSPR